MGWFKAKKSPPAVPAMQTALRSGWQAGWEWNRYAPLAGGEQRLYGTLRESVPIISAALEKTVRLIGTFQVECPDDAAQRELTEFLRHVPVGAAQAGTLIL